MVRVGPTYHQQKTEANESRTQQQRATDIRLIYANKEAGHQKNQAHQKGNDYGKFEFKGGASSGCGLLALLVVYMLNPRFISNR